MLIPHICTHALSCLQAEPVVANLQKEHKQETGKLVSVSAAPDKASRQADLAVADLAAAQQLLAAAETRRMEAESALRGVSEQLRQRQVRVSTPGTLLGLREVVIVRAGVKKHPCMLAHSWLACLLLWAGLTTATGTQASDLLLLLLQMDYASAISALERVRIMLEAKDRHADDVGRDVDLAGLEKERILGDQAGIAMAMQVCRVCAKAAVTGSFCWRTPTRVSMRSCSPAALDVRIHAHAGLRAQSTLVCCC